MKKQISVLGIVVLFLSCYGLAQTNGAATPFSTSTVHFEQNATDGDVEVVFEITGDIEGLAKLKITSPDGRTVVDFTASDPSTLGIRSFRFESPEPKDVAGLKAAYPEGNYTFTGEAVNGSKFSGVTPLNHTLPQTAAVSYPEEEAEDIAADRLTIKWNAVNDVSFIMFSLEQEDTELNISAKLPGSASAFEIPDGFLEPGLEYKIGIGTVMENGNLSTTESTFTTTEN